MKTIKIVLILLIAICQKSYTQNTQRDTLEITKNIIWYSPSKATNINGLMFNIFPNMKDESTRNLPQINGIEFEISPLSLLSSLMLVMHTIDLATHQPMGDTVIVVDQSNFKKVNGLHIGLCDIEEKIVNGIDISLSGSFGTHINGASISGIMNKHYSINGLSIALIGNHDIVTNGVQIGLFNSSKQLFGFQFGLWNVNQKRSFPIINWALKK